jgi:hypothetical protein
VIQTDKRWGGKRRPRITIPRAIKETSQGNLYKIFYEDNDKRYFRLVVAKNPSDAITLAIPRYSGAKFESANVVENNVIYQYDTYDVRYRGEHQDLLAAK